MKQQYPEQHHDIIRPEQHGQLQYNQNRSHFQTSVQSQQYHHHLQQQQQPQYQHFQHQNGFINGNLADNYYERPETSEYIELQESRRIIEVLHHRVRSLENINMDLEYRLEQQAKALMHAEHLYTEIDRSWKGKFAVLEKETEEWQNKYQQQVLKTEKLREHLSRTERELYGILQRKYQLMRGGPQGAHPHNPENGKDSENQNIQSLKQILTTGEANQAASTPLAANVASEEIADQYKKLPPDMRSKRLLMDMSDFLGL